jgi:hypothetical protein
MQPAKARSVCDSPCKEIPCVHAQSVHPLCKRPSAVVSLPSWSKYARSQGQPGPASQGPLPLVLLPPLHPALPAAAAWLPVVAASAPARSPGGCWARARKAGSLPPMGTHQTLVAAACQAPERMPAAAAAGARKAGSLPPMGTHQTLVAAACQAPGCMPAAAAAGARKAGSCHLVGTG